MMKRKFLQIFHCFLALALGLEPRSVFALQIHSAPEGLYSHQLAHVFFLISMAIFAFWLQRSRLVRIKGWRYIQISCLFFIVWNIMAMSGHVLATRLGQGAFVGTGLQTSLVLRNSLVPYFYYVLKMDHIVCVPAIVFLYLGLRALKRQLEGERR